MSSTATEQSRHTPQLQFMRAIYVYDRRATQVNWYVDGDTVVQVYPASARPGQLQNATRALVPPHIQRAVLDDFPALRRLAEIAEADQPGAPIEHPYLGLLRRDCRILATIVAVQAAAIVLLCMWALGDPPR